ncbi:glucosamine--fructose-6-phosphate aminotransferase [Chloropicon primus]|uniref:glutamine--fructose-6-phosphate transaminase (isomerizing) n=1 Tax=Chloropicon primus TaxID=1764295 RepID=A0A5B8MHA3_9CHLO|nr:glucosamine--fructose-6-phosphate aminotransferase [Chloropicon primus]|eukprot:QDZ19464.1 glucosamine--fructose-6-phosphate aminotransferase [Chloropicon primus]
MCGIFGIWGEGAAIEVAEKLIVGLRRLEYRGYDSSGIAFDVFDVSSSSSKRTMVVKEVGNIDKLSERLALTVQDEKTASLDFESVTRGHAAIAHTRWATHGIPSTVNSHPHLVRDSVGDVEFAVVHNGIITNYRGLKDFLIAQGLEFESDTDTEVIPKLCKYIYDGYTESQRGKVSFRELVSQVVGELEGAFALLFKSKHFPGELVGCKCGSPLLLGIKSEGDQGDGHTFVRQNSGCVDRLEESETDFYFASDASAIVEHTKRVVILEDNDVVHLKEGGYSIFTLEKGSRNTAPSLNDPSLLRQTNRMLQTLEMGVEQIMKGGYSHFMIKEIHEQPDALIETMRGRILLQTARRGSLSSLKEVDRSSESLRVLDSVRDLSLDSIRALGSGMSSDFDQAPCIKLGGLEDYVDNIMRSRRLIFIACGTSYHACLAARQLVEELTCVPVTLELASDLLDRQAPLFRDDTCVFVSQSGETADTLNALKYAKHKGALCLGITNTVGSSISRETDCGVHVNAGVEIGVASTKAYTCQILVIVMIALKLSEDSISKMPRRQEILRDLLNLPSMMKKVLEKESLIKELAKELASENSLLAFGRGYNYATAMELALKVKELSYMHSEGILAGELKHGPLALIDETMPAVVVATRDSLREKMWSTIQQLLARKGRLVLLVSKDDDEIIGHFSGNKNVRLIEVDTVCDCLQPVLNIVPFQLLSYHLTILRGYNVDQPRNLAKSVTVE